VHCLTLSSAGHKDAVDFTKAVNLFESAVQAASDRRPRWHDFVSTLGLALWSKYDVSDDVTDLDRALEQLAEAVRLKPHDRGVSEPFFLALGARLERTDKAVDFDRLIGMVARLLAGIPAGEPVGLELRFSLGAAWYWRYWHTNEPTNLDQAVDLYRQVAEQCPHDAPAGPVYRSAWEEVLAATPPDHPPPPRYFFNQGRARMLALERTNDWGELDAAINLYEQGAQAVTQPPAGPLLNLAHAHFTRFLRADGDYDLRQAIKRFNEVLDDWPPVPRDPHHEHTLALALLARYEREQDVNDLTSMIDVYDRTLKSTAPDHFLRSAMESNLGIALRNRFQRTRVEDDLARAIKTDERSVRRKQLANPMSHTATNSE
jgi:tetratricopeptide (TPR) repeat protein